MGMFDSLFIDNSSVLPICKEYQDLIGKDFEFQTKDFDCLLQHYYIKNKELFVRHEQRFEVPIAERPDPQNLWFGSVRVEYLPLQKMSDFSEQIGFYSSLKVGKKETWISFIATFEKGVLIKIENYNGF